jgi:hypothetical protein
MFLFLAAAVVSVFAFLSIAVWVSTPAHERQVRERMELLKTVAEQPGENAARVLELLREEDQRREDRRREEERRGYVLGGMITAAVGVGLGTLLATTRAGGEWSLGLMLLLVGAVLVGSGWSIGRRRQR